MKSTADVVVEEVKPMTSSPNRRETSLCKSVEEGELAENYDPDNGGAAEIVSARSTLSHSLVLEVLYSRGLGFDELGMWNFGFTSMEDMVDLRSFA
ncbi:hypothetical protein NL676_025733 [Syzygium grande]|nr:hypothetical protein NL676_025733 [Syzygium grande]